MRHQGAQGRVGTPVPALRVLVLGVHEVERAVAQHVVDGLVPVHDRVVPGDRWCRIDANSKRAFGAALFTRQFN